MFLTSAALKFTPATASNMFAHFLQLQSFGKFEEKSTFWSSCQLKGRTKGDFLSAECCHKNSGSSCRKSKTGQKGRVTREPRVRRKLRNRKTGNRKLREGAANLAKKRLVLEVGVFFFVDREYSYEGGLHCCKPIRADLETAHFQLFEFLEDTFGPGTNHSREKILIQFFFVTWIMLI